MIDNQNVERRIKMLEELILRFIDQIGIERNRVRLSIPSLVSTVTDTEIDIEKDKGFHNLSAISETKEISTLCYYFLKRKPLVVLDETSHDASMINEKFCAYLLLSVSTDIIHLDKNYVKFLISMLYKGDISKEALYLIAQTLKMVDESGRR